MPDKQSTRIIVEVKGGVCQAVYCSDPEADVDLIDYDNAEADEACARECQALAKEAAKLHAVF